MDLIRDTKEKHGQDFQSAAYWRNYLVAAESTDTMEAWIAMVIGKLAAMLHACDIEGRMHIVNVFSLRKYLRHYTNNALVYTFTQDALKRPEIEEVSFGWASIKTGLESLDHFKTWMGFAQVPIGQRIVIHPFLRPFLRGRLLSFALNFCETRAHRERFNKLAGLLRWYQEQPG